MVTDEGSDYALQLLRTHQPREQPLLSIRNRQNSPVWTTARLVADPVQDTDPIIEIGIQKHTDSHLFHDKTIPLMRIFVNIFFVNTK